MSGDKPEVTVLKIGGSVIDDPNALESVLTQFAAVPGFKVLVHGGGKIATELATKMGIPQTMTEGRRLTDPETLKIITMVFAGLVNKQIVVKLQGKKIPALGVTGADGDLIRAHKRSPIPKDYGFVGDIDHVNLERLSGWLNEGLTPVIAPLTHDGQGQLLNTNADAIANGIAEALARQFKVTLIYGFEKPGVLLDAKDETSVIPEITMAHFQDLRSQGKVFEGMIPKLENAFRAIRSGVSRVVIGKAENLGDLLAGKAGTRLFHG